MRKRNVAILFRLNKKEAEALDKKVKRSGLNREAYLRQLISGVVPRDAPPPDYYSMMRKLHRFRDGSYTPAAGDIIFFDWGNNGTIDHVGIVESVSGGTVNTIEGNSGDKVARRSYSIGSSNIYGYGVPAY